MPRARTTSKRVWISLLSVMLATGCAYDNLEDLYPDACGVSDVTWTGTIRPLVQSRCALPECHVAGATMGDFTTYAGIKSKADSGLLDIVLDLNLMPPSIGLDSCTRERLRVWLEHDAPED